VLYDRPELLNSKLEISGMSSGTQVILNRDIETLGSHGEIVTVSKGYYRNYLKPKKLAVLLTTGSQKDLDQRIQRIKVKAEQRHQLVLENAAKIKDLGTLTLEANAGETGKLYGTITTKDLSALLGEKLGFELDRRSINVDRPINQLGDYVINIKLSPKVTATTSLEVHSAVIASLQTAETEEEDDEFSLEDAFEDDSV
jgi:large subunit ribosomal protein L9